jgi:hypothetical protein
MGGATTVAELNAVREAVLALARALKRVSVYRHAPDQHQTILEQALIELRGVLEQRQSFTVAVAPTGLMYEGEALLSEAARENFCFRLHRDGVRSLTFKKGLTLDELLGLSRVAMADVNAGDREDAVTELWKADLEHLGYSAGSGYRMDESAGAGISASIGEIAARVQGVLDRYVSDRFVETAQQTLLWNEAQRAKADPRDWPALASRAAMTVLRIVGEDYAGWDVEALRETFARLCEQLLEHEAATQLSQALVALKALSGAHAADFREWMGRWLLESTRLSSASQAVGAAKFLPAWLNLLPADAGPGILAVLPRAKEPAAREALARAALLRLESCGALVADLLRSAPEPEVRPLLALIGTLGSGRRAELAAAAFSNRDSNVAAEAIHHIAVDPQLAARLLGAGLSRESRALRMASAQALSTCGGVAERVAAVLIEAMTAPRFAKTDKEERALFHRSLGRLGSTAGFNFLSSQLALPPKKVFGRKQRLDARLLAVQGLAEDGSARALRVLDENSRAGRGASKAVAAACRAAAQALRARKTP